MDKIKTGFFVGLFSLATLVQADQMAYSQSPPGGLQPAQCPQFVCFGFDDNGYEDGILWFRELVKDKKNADGSPVRATFFLTGQYGENFPEVLEAWKKLYGDGHEIGNHTWDHPHGVGLTEQGWKDEISKSTEYLVQNLGIGASEIKGFRTPFLEYGETALKAVQGCGLMYDCSMEFANNGWTPIEGDPDYPPATSGVYWNGMGSERTFQKLFWPHTLDKGSPPGNASKCATPIPGLWEVNVNSFLKADNSGDITGFDFNLWTISNKEYFANTLKHTFDQRLKGNRCPMTINAHTDYYTQYNEDAERSFTQAGWQDRRAAVEAFLDYVLQFPEVRVVSYITMINWMKNPQPLGSVATMPAASRSPVRSIALGRVSASSIDLSVPAAGRYQVRVLSPSGRLVQSYDGSFGIGKGRLSFARPLPPGSYLVSVRGTTGPTAIHPVVIMR
jgi:hypothetical protein